MSKRRAEDDASFWSAKAICARQDENTREEREREEEKARAQKEHAARER